MNQHLVHLIAVTGTEDVLIGILENLVAAERKHPEWPQDLIHQSAIVSEEAGELTRACLQWQYEDGDLHQVSVEANHTGAMAVRLLKNLFDRI
ncbi:MAG: hypothetical protein JNM22_05565 [Saprospiraceae bacterium]|nr:hypothetical protein [Saprospiraceae bacterium]